jgi:hypothetical protein
MFKSLTLRIDETVRKCRFGVAASAFAGMLLSVSTMVSAQISLPPSGIIRTVAGNGIQGYSGDGANATAASMNWMLGIYIADSGNFRVREVFASTGEIVTVAGNGSPQFSGDHGPATQAGLGSPVGIAVDAGKNLYILTATRIRRVSASDGIISTVVGGDTGGYAGDGGPASEAQINNASGIDLDAGGNLYIADFANNRVRKVTVSTGTIDTIAGNGQAGSSGDGGPAINSELNGPYSLAVDRDGNVYITEYSDCRVRRISISNGQINTIAGTGSCGSSGDGGAATSAALGALLGIALDPQGNVYLGDSTNNRVRRVDLTHGVISTIAGNGTVGLAGDNGPATNAELETIYGLAMDQAGYLYVLNSAAGLVRAVGPGAMQNPSFYNVALSSSDPEPVMGESVTLKANVTSDFGLPAISGTITWYIGGDDLGQSGVDGNGIATIVTTISTAGDQQITAIYAGVPSGSGSITLPVSGFALLGPSNSSITVASGQSAQIVINAAAFHGFNRIVDLTCSGFPYPGFCALSPSSVDFTKSMTEQAIAVTLKTTTGVTTTPNHSQVDRKLALVSLGSLILLGFRTKRALRFSRMAIPVSLVLSFALALSGCGSNSLQPVPINGSPSKLVTLPAGTYTVILKATSGNENAEFPITVTVQ